MRGALPHTVYAPPPPRRRTGVIAAVLGLALLAVLLVSQHAPPIAGGGPNRLAAWQLPILDRYNYTYPGSAPIKTAEEVGWRFLMVADLDEASRAEDEAEGSWSSRLVTGVLYRHLTTGALRVEVHDEGKGEALVSYLAAKDRGAELSELQFYNGKMMTVDDRTGIVFEIQGHTLVPRFILADGDGQTGKVMKAEWMAVKDRQLYVGSIGRDWTSGKGEYINSNPKWVKIISPGGAVHFQNWTLQYQALQDAAGLPDKGYLWHESGAWSKIHRRWFFLPRRVSSEPYDEDLDEKMGGNIMLSADEAFERLTVTRIGELDPVRGFSSFKFVPGSDDSLIMALKTVELEGKTATYITVFDVPGGQILLPDTRVSDHKLEGMEFA